MTDMALSQGARGRADWRGDWRLILLMGAFCVCYAAVGLRMAVLAATDPEEPKLAWSGTSDRPVRGTIVDRNGALLAANLPAWSLYAHPQEIKEPVVVAEALARVFPDIDARALANRLGGKRRFLWIKRPITPREKQAVRDLGFPGIHFGNREIRIYPAGRTVAHLMGRVKAAKEAVRFAELAGAGGVEQVFDARLGDPAKAGEPLRLSLDLAVQTAVRAELATGMTRLHAKGASAVLMKVETGEILALVSLPDFDPNRPPLFRGPAAENPRFNRAAQGVYELGSTFKVLTAAMALDAGIAQPGTMIATPPSLRYGRFTIRDSHPMPEEMSLTDIVVDSSNVGTARVSLMIGTRRFKRYLEKLGLFEPLDLELAEAGQSQPLLPERWNDLSTMTISYGHGLAVTPVHLAAAYATLANGGVRVNPTLLAGGKPHGKRVFSEQTSAALMRMMRDVVTRGTARAFGEVPGYEVGGKTGTAEKPHAGRYDRRRVISTFASVFPTSRPKYVLIVSLDEPEDRSGRRPVRSASRTAVPVAADIIRRVAPIMGLRPLQDRGAETRPTLAIKAE